MNNTKKTIKWCDFSWNPISGCRNSCWYCYAAKIAKRFPRAFPNGFEPTYHPERLDEPWKLKKPSKIFVCSNADLFASWTPNEWRDAVLQTIFDCPVQHIFQLLTKFPGRIPHLRFPDNVWVGTTVTGEDPDEVYRINRLKWVRAKIRFISFEPLLGPIDFTKVNLKGIQWVIIGKLTGGRPIPPYPKLQWKWVEDILKEADIYKAYPVRVFLKNSLFVPSLPECCEPRQEFPQIQTISEEEEEQ